MRKRMATPELLSFAVKHGPVLGGTASVFPPFPSELSGAGINPRDPRSNYYRGMTITRPTPDVRVLGLAFDDLKDGNTAEDFYVLDVGTGAVTPYMQGRLEAVNPAYSATHRGPKDHLPPGPSQLSQVLIDLE